MEWTSTEAPARLQWNLWWRCRTDSWSVIFMKFLFIFMPNFFINVIFFKSTVLFILKLGHLCLNDSLDFLEVNGYIWWWDYMYMHSFNFIKKIIHGYPLLLYGYWQFEDTRNIASVPAFCNLHIQYMNIFFVGITCWEIENFLPNPVDEGKYLYVFWLMINW